MIYNIIFFYSILFHFVLDLKKCSSLVKFLGLDLEERERLRSQWSSTEHQQSCFAFGVRNLCLHRCVCACVCVCLDLCKWKTETGMREWWLSKDWHLSHVSSSKTWLTLISHMLFVLKCSCNHWESWWVSIYAQIQ